MFCVSGRRTAAKTAVAVRDWAGKAREEGRIESETQVPIFGPTDAGMFAHVSTILLNGDDELRTLPCRMKELCRRERVGQGSNGMAENALAGKDYS